MNKVLHRFDVDARQLKALLKLAWRMDMRKSKTGFRTRKARNPLAMLFFSLFFYLFIGAVFANFAITANSTFVSGLLAISGVMFMLGGMTLVEYNTIVISPDDYHILGSMPVSSRTYFIAKILNMLLYIWLFTTFLSLPTILVHLLRGGLHWERGLFAAFAFYSASLAVSLGVTVLYGHLLRILPARILKNILAYAQFFLSICIYAGYIILPVILERFFQKAQFHMEWWHLLVPSVWFTSIIEVGYGVRSGLVLTAALIGVTLTIVIIKAVSSRISLDYAQRIAVLTQESNEAGGKYAAGRSIILSLLLRLCRSNESRLVMRLSFAQFRHDNKFKMSILGVLPLMVIYFYMGLLKGKLPDPFIAGGAGLGKFYLFFFALLLIPFMVKHSMEVSDSFESSWIFFTSPVDNAKIILAARNILFFCFSLPTILFVFCIFIYYFETSLHAFLHALTISAIIFIIIQVMYLSRPKLPFSEPKTRGSQSRFFAFFFFILPLCGLGILYLIITLVYNFPLRLPLLYVGLTLLIIILEKLIRIRVAAATHTLQHAD